MSNAQEHLERAIKINPDFADAHYELALILRDNEEFEKAKVHFLRTIEIKPDDPLSILMGGATVEGKQFNEVGFYVSRDWLLLDLLVLALIFIPIELFFPKNKSKSTYSFAARSLLFVCCAS